MNTPIYEMIVVKMLCLTTRPIGLAGDEAGIVEGKLIIFDAWPGVQHVIHEFYLSYVEFIF